MEWRGKMSFGKMFNTKPIKLLNPKELKMKLTNNALKILHNKSGNLSAIDNRLLTGLFMRKPSLADFR